MYKIIGIYNKDKKRTPKTVGRYPLRVGRIVSEETVWFANVGSPLIMKYISDENGKDYQGHYLWCSRLYRKTRVDNFTIELETKNTIYVLKRTEA